MGLTGFSHPRVSTALKRLFAVVAAFILVATLAVAPQGNPLATTPDADAPVSYTHLRAHET